MQTEVGRVCEGCDFYITDRKELSQKEFRQSEFLYPRLEMLGPGGWCIRGVAVNFVKSTHHCGAWINMNQRIANKSW